MKDVKISSDVVAFERAVGGESLLLVEFGNLPSDIACRFPFTVILDNGEVYVCKMPNIHRVEDLNIDEDLLDRYIILEIID